MKLKLFVSFGIISLIIIALNLLVFFWRYASLDILFKQYVGVDISRKMDNKPPLSKKLQVVSQNEKNEEEINWEEVLDPFPATLNDSELELLSFDFKENSNKKIAVVIDDLGYSMDPQYFLLTQIPFKLNIAVIPGTLFSNKIVELEAERPENIEILMHMPMSPKDKVSDSESKWSALSNYKFMLSKNMDKQTIKETLNLAFKDLRGKHKIKGINNHMGSYVTSSSDMCLAIVEWANENGLYVLDSMTDSSSVLYEIAKLSNAKTAVNDLFIDNEDDFDKIIQRLDEVYLITKKQEYAIIIGHLVRDNTMEALFKWMNTASTKGYEFVFISEVINEQKL